MTPTMACIIVVSLPLLPGFITSTGDAVRSCPLPSCYSERYDTHELRALPHPAPPKASPALARPSLRLDAVSKSVSL